MIVAILNHRVRPAHIAVRIRVRVSALFIVRIHVRGRLLVAVSGRRLVMLLMAIFRSVLGAQLGWKHHRQCSNRQSGNQQS